MGYNKKSYIYDLYGICNHVGGVNGGHYYSVCKNYLDDNWYEYNDSHVSQIPNHKVLDYSPYLFVYKRL